MRDTALPGPEPRSGRRRRWAAVVVIVLLLGIVGITLLPVLPELERLLGLVPGNEWAWSVTQATQLHAKGLDGSGVILCVVDTGVDLQHPGLSDVNLLAWKDLVNGREDPYDDEGHGTAMVGLIAAQGQVSGLAPKVSLVVVKAITETGESGSSVVLEGITFCMDPFGNNTRSHIISLSLGGSTRPVQEDEVAAAAAEAVSKGIFVVAAAGNEGSAARDVQSPASEPLVIAVGAVDSSLRIAPFSQGGNNGPRPFNPEGRTDPNKKPEAVAPGVDLVTASLDGKYVRISGTSAAAAFVSALLALILQGMPSLKIASSSSGVLQLKMALMETARELDDQEVPHDDLYGYGLIQGLDLLEAL
ncbi:MAG: S8 family serine peptidase [Thermoplasmata archaeon]